MTRKENFVQTDMTRLSPHPWLLLIRIIYPDGEGGNNVVANTNLQRCRRLIEREHFVFVVKIFDASESDVKATESGMDFADESPRRRLRWESIAQRVTTINQRSRVPSDVQQLSVYV